MTSVCWTTYTAPESLVNVGPDIVAMVSNRTFVVFINAKTKEKSYFKPEKKGLGISCLAGHERFPMFAFAESVLRPRTYVMRFPELTIINMLDSPNNLRINEMKFSNNDHLVLITGYPKYFLRVWNFRTNKLCVDEPTKTIPVPWSIALTNDSLPQIAEASMMAREILIWDMCKIATGFVFHQIADIPLDDVFEKTLGNNFSYTDESGLVLVDDYGCLYVADTWTFRTKLAWAPTTDDAVDAEEKKTPYKHGLSYNVIKNGVLIWSELYIRFLIKRKNHWQVEWVVENPEVMLEKMVSNNNGEVYGADKFGNIYTVVVKKGRASLEVVTGGNCLIRDYIFLKGLRDNTFLLLIDPCELRVVNLQFTKLSSLTVENISCLSPHNTSPYCVAGTTNGELEFFSYEQMRMPKRMGSIQVSKAPITAIRYTDTYGLVRDACNDFHIVFAECKKGIYWIMLSLDNSPSVFVIDFFLLSELLSILFVNLKEESERERVPICDEIWVCELMKPKSQMRRFEYDSPYHYHRFAMSGIPPGHNAWEFLALRQETPVIDVFHFRDQGELGLELSLVSSIKTAHYPSIVGVTAMRNMMTWGVLDEIFHFRQHKRAKFTYGVSRFLNRFYNSVFIKKCEEFMNGKYLIHHYVNGVFTIFNLESSSENIREDDQLLEAPLLLQPKSMMYRDAFAGKVIPYVEPTAAEMQMKENLLADLEDLARRLRELIAYDMSVTGRTQGIFRKFCLNQDWLKRVLEQGRLVCAMERKALTDAIQEQERIRDWVWNLVFCSTEKIGLRLRSIFSNTVMESFPIRKELAEFNKQYDLYRMYDLHLLSQMFEDDEPEPSVHDADEGSDALGEEEEEEEGKKRKTVVKARKRYVVHGSYFDHVMAGEFAIQDPYLDLTDNIAHNNNAKFKILLNDPLRVEFNKEYMEVFKYKQEIIAEVLETNKQLQKIQDNTNCMLCLLEMDKRKQIELSVPTWENDEIEERILTVDDSELKAINRRKKKAIVEAAKSGRMLLWSYEFWKRSLITMMDGVLEKLWEEEIKKDIPIPEFISKKEVHEFTIDEQRALRDYEEKVKQLHEDRKKYLRILADREKKTNELKASQIRKFNERLARASIKKLEYDFAIHHNRLRLLTSKYDLIERMALRDKVHDLKSYMSKIKFYTTKYQSLSSAYEQSVSDTKAKLEAAQLRDRTLEKQFKSQFVKALPQHIAAEVMRQYKRHPKFPQRALTALICFEMASRVAPKGHRATFPLPPEMLDYLQQLDALDDKKNAPNQIDQKNWEQLCKYRRIKWENELKVKGVHYELLDAQSACSIFAKTIDKLNEAGDSAQEELKIATADYIDKVVNKRLQVTLDMSQMEVNVGGDLTKLESTILMNRKDLDGINDEIKEAGEQKIRAMKKVAFFRRQVLYAEWEHKVAGANVVYLNYMRNVIARCKVTKEFLEVLRNWERAKKEGQKMQMAGQIDRVVQMKVAAHRKNLERINGQIEDVKSQITQMKRKNHRLDREIMNIKVEISLGNVHRDFLLEERRKREMEVRMAQIRQHANLMNTIRDNHARILELRTILEILRLRTYPTLGPPPPQCPPSRYPVPEPPSMQDD